MTRVVSLVLGAIALLLPVSAATEPVPFKLLPNYSRATFKSDAPLETFVGNTAAEGVQGNLMLDLARPQEAKGTVRVDLNTVKTGIDKRDADMRSENYLGTAVDANRWAVFELKSVEFSGPLQVGREMPAKVKGTLTIKQRPVEIVADSLVTYVTLTPEQVEQQRRFGFTTDNVKVKAKFATTFTNHGMQVPQLPFLKVANEIQLEADLVFARQ
jgi:polyisoprenoid-binding protein YceI